MYTLIRGERMYLITMFNQKERIPLLAIDDSKLTYTQALGIAKRSCIEIFNKTFNGKKRTLQPSGFSSHFHKTLGQLVSGDCVVELHSVSEGRYNKTKLQTEVEYMYVDLPALSLSTPYVLIQGQK